MISVERTFYERFPRLADGRARAFAQPVVQILRRVACEERINRTLEGMASLAGFDFVERVLEHLRVSYSVAHTERENIPSEGRVVIVANHPLGALDALALLHLVGSVRRDVRILANDVLMQLGQLKPLLLPLPVFGGGSAGGIGGARGAYRALEQEQAVLVFPAGEVSRLGAQGVRDRAWSSGFARLALKTGTPVVPVHIAAHNSAMFYGLSALAKPLSALLLAREMFAASEARLSLRVGEMVTASALDPAGLGADALARRMRRQVYRLPSGRAGYFPTTSRIAHPESPLLVRRALDRGETIGSTRDGKRIVVLDGASDCAALREIGRLREVAFRRVGEGSGARRDLDRFDAHYQHIVLWDEAALAIVGAYRLGEVGPLLARGGFDALYSAQLFDYAPSARDFLGQAVELGRSFVQPAYWGSRSLDYLWQGVGAWLRRREDVRYLIGPVSLSASLPLAAREWIVAAHRRYFPDPQAAARARRPFAVSAGVAAEAAAAFAGLDSTAGLARLRERLAGFGASLPTLYRQYVELVEPDGVRFLDFGVDPAFADCVDGLIRLDLARLRPAKRARYLGGEGGLRQC